MQSDELTRSLERQGDPEATLEAAQRRYRAGECLLPIVWPGEDPFLTFYMGGWSLGERIRRLSEMIEMIYAATRIPRDLFVPMTTPEDRANLIMRAQIEVPLWMSPPHVLRDVVD